jgi:hypothetical protein
LLGGGANARLRPSARQCRAACWMTKGSSTPRKMSASKTDQPLWYQCPSPSMLSPIASDAWGLCHRLWGPPGDRCQHQHQTLLSFSPALQMPLLAARRAGAEGLMRHSTAARSAGSWPTLPAAAGPCMGMPWAAMRARMPKCGSEHLQPASAMHNCRVPSQALIRPPSAAQLVAFMCAQAPACGLPRQRGSSCTVQ